MEDNNDLTILYTRKHTTIPKLSYSFMFQITQQREYHLIVIALFNCPS